ncbi:MAG: spore germination protein [Tepidanaerobacteraceae bacterium]|nr:spore germination protein [Tepidanaerobacteraceae bacterium]
MESKKLILCKIMSGILAAVLMVAAFVPNPAQAAGYVKVMINGQLVNFDVQPVIEQGRTMVPFRGIGETLGAFVNWDQNTRTVTARKGDTTVILKVGSTTAYVNKNPVKLDAPPLIRNDRTLVPLRFFSEAFGASVLWQNATRTVVINTGEKLTKYIMGYYYSQSYDDFLKNYDKMSSIAVKWYTLDDNGDVTDNYASPRWIMVPEGYEEVVKLSKENGIKIYMLLFESDGGKLQKVLSTLDSRKRLVNQVMTVVEREGYDGVNIDFEYLKSADKEKFSEFIKGLSEALHARGKSLNISLPAKTEKADWWPGYDYQTLGRYSDFVVLMAYDKNPASPEPQAGIDWVEQVVDYALARIPAEKIVLGIGYFGYDWAASGGKNTVLATRNGISISGLLFADELVEKYGIKFTIDKKSKMAYGTYVDSNGVSHQIWMENEASVDAKAKLVIKKGLKGIALWRLGYTTPSFWDTIYSNFKAVKE